MTKQYLYIGGDWVKPRAGGDRATLDPANGEELARVAEATEPDVHDAVRAAQDARENPDWAGMSPAARGELLWRIAELIDANGDELARLETRDQGQPLGIARHISVRMAAEQFRYFAGWCTKIEGSTTPVSVPDTLLYTRREPVGVCALITPWNFPLMISAWKLAPALACGNTVILKPAEQTPLSCIRLVELCAQAGVPAGVLNLLTGGPEVGAALVEHPGVDKVSFTGSTEVGRRIVAASAGNLKRVTLELGGKAPSLILADADIDGAVAGNLQGGLLNSGQVCAAYTRFFVHRSRADEFVTKLAAGAGGMRLGPGLDEQTQLGPLVSEEHLDRVDGAVRTGVREGAALVVGGERADGDLAKGYFYRPTVFTDVTDEMALAREEIFGPVLAVLPYDDADELVARANDTQYGLAAAIWTRDLRAAHRTAAALQAGSVYVNQLPVLDPAAPWGGYKASGWGREMSRNAIDEFTETKSVWVGLG